MSREIILKLTYENEFSHIGSSLGVYQVLKEIEKVKRENDIVTLDEAHGALGYYVWLEEQGIGSAQELIVRHGVHQNKDVENNILVSGGSLGLVGSISLGLALANKDRDCYCITSDGSLMEGIWWEVLRVKSDMKIDNFKIYVNANGYGAYHEINTDNLMKRVHIFCPDVVFVKTQVDGLKDHYRKVTEEEYEKMP